MTVEDTWETGSKTKKKVKEYTTMLTPTRRRELERTMERVELSSSPKLLMELSRLVNIWRHDKIILINCIFV